MIPDKYSLEEISRNIEFYFLNTYQLYCDGIGDYPFSEFNRSCISLYSDNSKEMENPSKITKSYFQVKRRGLSNNRDSFTELLYELRSESFSFDYIGISELWKFEDDFRLYLPGYHKLLVQNCQDDDRGGVGLFEKERINYKLRKYVSGNKPHVVESLFAEITSISISSRNEIIGIIYRPNTQPRVNHDIFLSTLTELFCVIEDEGKACVEG